MRSSETRKRNIIIGSLCGVLLLMAVGYAAFNTMLNINGTASISSNWKILITNIETKNKVGGASNAKEPTGIGSLTATFATNLVSPGDSIEYDITVTNQGSLDAVLSKITLSDSNNPAIKFTTSGLKKGDILTSGQSQVLTVKVEYSNSVTSQPDSTASSLTVTLDYVQNDANNPILPDNDFVYSWEYGVMPGAGLTGKETTTDYNTLGKTFFLKHNLNNDVVESSEVCFIKDGLHCLVGGDNGAAYETNKALLLNVFGETNCRNNTPANNIPASITCDNGLHARAATDGQVGVDDGNLGCYVQDNGQAYCDFAQ